jgi:osmotically-inducible protein OsmY
MSKTNDEIKHAVRSALSDDPRLPFHDEVAVEAYDGLVTLRGTVGSFAQERAAVADARRQSDKAFDHMTSLRGVTGVTNEITVEERLP